MRTLTDVLYVVVTLGLLLLAIVMVQAWRHDRDVHAERAELEVQTSASLRACEDDLTRFATDVERAAPLDELGELVDEDWSAARSALTRAEELLASPSSPAVLERVTAHIEEGRAALARAQAAVLAEEAIDAPPCFFNPNHGPSDTTVSWTTNEGARVRVPSCAADAARIQSGADPYWRTIAVDDLRLPWWQSGAHGACWARGWFARWHAHPTMPSLIAVAPMLSPTWDDDQRVSRAA